MSEPWKTEPDALDFIDDATGYPVALRRNHMGAWCAYIGVPKDHPWHGNRCPDLVKAPWAFERSVDVAELGAINLYLGAARARPEEGIYPIDVLVRCHGGLTYSAEAWWEDETRASWWFGFDCTHAGDLVPTIPPSYDGIYRNMEFVRAAASKAARDLRVAAVSLCMSDAFEIACGEHWLAYHRLIHAARGWALPTHPGDSLADVPNLIADFEQAATRVAQTAREAAAETEALHDA